MRRNCLFFRSLYHQLRNCPKKNCLGDARARAHTHHTHTHHRVVSHCCSFNALPIHPTCTVIFSVMPFGWFICMYLILVFMGIIFFIYAFLIYTHFFRNITGGLKQGLGVCVCVCVCVHMFVYVCVYVYIYVCVCVYRVSQEERTKLREGVPYVKLYRYNPKHLCPKLNGF